ncbi:Imm59 family immunity protein [Streptococcus equi]|uniref:Imm59 family immunity protein n=1 Tax=Streptococcus equi TaxID=1336 RepID=UPI0005BD9FA2|nr:Imm59 family immunity protein [Streptococcus equi]KIS07073.1 hypothetical protein AT53_01698 [Streptococcus equi subsp. zooepidemicus Sz5]MCD3374155.1 hypothetical protein [Streptococcus equi subsp. zooepidemicus]MCD3394228.1 hypothetical protein [Streptococcus equi subsp. zooepidemicus]MCD3449776.1 hypothetical protein [Streptococcus equi subsp. zooepidemicus]MCD3454608.1 hypothetical protein [Streptococcus equi subsp. zooepidemicus]
MKTLERQKQEILREIHRLGYDTLRFSIFSKERPGEWETVIEYDNSQGLYVVYATMDRASYNKKLTFETFQETKEKFLEKLRLDIQINRYYVEEGMPVNYDSPLWSNN